MPTQKSRWEKNCLAVSIIYQHGNVVDLNIKFERPVLSPQLCSEEFLIGGNVFPKNKTVITENWLGERRYRYTTFYKDKCIICRMKTDCSAWAEGVKRGVAAPKCLHKRKFAANRLEDRG